MFDSLVDLFDGFSFSSGDTSFGFTGDSPTGSLLPIAIVFGVVMMFVSVMRK